MAGLLSTIGKHTASEDSAFEYLVEQGLLAKERRCSKCYPAPNLSLIRRSDIADGWTWRCSLRGCRTKVSIRKDSFFSQSKLRLTTWIKLMYLWTSDIPVTKVRCHLDDGECSTTTAVDAYYLIRDIYTGKLLASPVLLGGPGIVVQIDESLMRHNHKVWLQMNK